MSRAAVFFLMFIAPLLALVLSALGVMTFNATVVGWFLLLVGAVNFFGIILVAFFRRGFFRYVRAQDPVVQQESGDRSYWMVIPGMLAVFFLPPAEYLWQGPLLPVSFLQGATGLSSVLLGTFLFVWSLHALGVFYSGHVSITQNQPLVQHGPYRLIRHPAYAGYLLMGLGISLGYSSAAGMVALPLLLIPGLVYRIRIEDSLLESRFGDDFRRYKARTARLLPGVW